MLIERNSDLKEFVKKVMALKEFCFDTETTSINPLDAELVALAFSWEKGDRISYSFP